MHCTPTPAHLGRAGLPTISTRGRCLLRESLSRDCHIPNKHATRPCAVQIDILDLKPRKNPSTGKTYGSNAAANCERCFGLRPGSWPASAASR